MREGPPQETRDDRRGDDALVEACLAGDGEAWEALIRRYRRLIYSIPVGYGMSTEDADEVFQTVALILLDKLATLERSGSLAAWLMTTTRRECWRLRRGADRTVATDDERLVEIPDEAPVVADALHQIACEHTASLALDQLDEPCRTLLHALFVEDPRPSYDEISERIGRPVGSLGPTRRRCLDKLGRLYRRLGGGEP